MVVGWIGIAWTASTTATGRQNGANLCRCTTNNHLMMIRHPMSKLHHVHFVFDGKLMNMCHVFGSFLFWVFRCGFFLVTVDGQILCAKNKEKSKENFEVSPSTFHSSNESIICKPGHDNDNNDVYLE